jgi:hypothetical protein
MSETTPTPAPGGKLTTAQIVGIVVAMTALAYGLYKAHKNNATLSAALSPVSEPQTAPYGAAVGSDVGSETNPAFGADAATTVDTAGPPYPASAASSSGDTTPVSCSQPPQTPAGSQVTDGEIQETASGLGQDATSPVPTPDDAYVGAQSGRAKEVERAAERGAEVGAETASKRAAAPAGRTSATTKSKKAASHTAKPAAKPAGQRVPVQVRRA